ncbi:MAG: 30S ribosomal protein S6 [bacterium]|nr:30S ribosomal protein S6 [bacterium]
MSTRESVEESNDTNELDMTERVYELGYLLVPTIPEEEVPAAFGNLKEMATSLGGIPVSEEMPKLIPLAYTMSKVVQNVRHKFNTAYFGWIKFTMETEKVLELKKKLDLDPNLVRFLLLKTVKENTIAARRFVRPDMHKRPKSDRPEGTEVPVAINKEEIDKEIDAMVSV